MSEILSRAWIISHRLEMCLLILVAYLFQRNVNSGHLPTKAVDPEAFMNVVSWGFSYFGDMKYYMLTFVSV
jgi:lipase-like abhydrolase domain-containing protein 3